MTTTIINIKNVTGFPRDEKDVYIGRNMMWTTKYKLPESDWHNPFKVDIYNEDGTIKKKRDGTLDEVIVKFAEYLSKNESLLRRLYDGELSDKVLGCWCVEKEIDYVRRDKVCHGEVLLQWVGMLEEWHDMSLEEAVKRLREVLDDVDLLGLV